jgi:hypothetical protein
MFIYQTFSQRQTLVITLTADVPDANFATLATNEGIDVTKGADVYLDFNGFTCYATTTGNYGFTVGTTWNSKSTLYLRGVGGIRGMGGAGGDTTSSETFGWEIPLPPYCTNGQVGGNGGPAMLVDRDVIFEDGSAISVWGGGGGGGGGSSQRNHIGSFITIGGGGGGGGAGYATSAGGKNLSSLPPLLSPYKALYDGQVGGVGNRYGPGAGGRGGGYPNPPLVPALDGGNGGTWGAAGTDGGESVYGFTGNPPQATGCFGGVGGSGGNSIVQTTGTYTGTPQSTKGTIV